MDLGALRKKSNKNILLIAPEKESDKSPYREHFRSAPKIQSEKNPNRKQKKGIKEK